MKKLELILIKKKQPAHVLQLGEHPILGKFERPDPQMELRMTYRDPIKERQELATDWAQAEQLTDQLGIILDDKQDIPPGILELYFPDFSARFPTVEDYISAEDGISALKEKSEPLLAKAFYQKLVEITNTNYQELSFRQEYLLREMVDLHIVGFDFTNLRERSLATALHSLDNDQLKQICSLINQFQQEQFEKKTEEFNGSKAYLEDFFKAFKEGRSTSWQEKKRIIFL